MHKHWPAGNELVVGVDSLAEVEEGSGVLWHAVVGPDQEVKLLYLPDRHGRAVLTTDLMGKLHTCVIGGGMEGGREWMSKGGREKRGREEERNGKREKLYIMGGGRE